MAAGPEQPTAPGTGETCTWCGATVGPGDGFRAHEPAAERHAVFCRLEHIVPWELQGENWLPEPAHYPGTPGGEAGDVPGSDSGGRIPPEPGSPVADAPWEEMPGKCSQCDAPLDDTAVLLIRHRGEHRIGDGFCSSAHMAAWAKAGGRWQ